MGSEMCIRDRYQLYFGQLFAVAALDEFPTSHPLWLAVGRRLCLRSRGCPLGVAFPARLKKEALTSLSFHPLNDLGHHRRQGVITEYMVRPSYLEKLGSIRRLGDDVFRINDRDNIILGTVH